MAVQGRASAPSGGSPTETEFNWTSLSCGNSRITWDAEEKVGEEEMIGVQTL